MQKINVIVIIVALLLAAFGVFTLYLSSAVLLDLFGVRAKEGNYVWFVVFANFISSFLYLITSYGLMTKKPWAIRPISGALIILLMAFIGLIIHIQFGGAYEQKTVYGMVFRTTLTIVFVLFTNKKINSWKKHSFLV